MDDREKSQWAAKENIFNNLFKTLLQKAQISNEWTVAEFGIGKWGFGRFYLQHVKRVIGIDIEDYSARHPGVEFALSDGETIPIEDAAVDMVVSHSVLEHVMALDVAMSEIDRILKPGGVLYLTVSPLYYSSFGAHLYSEGKRVENWQHLDPNSEYYLSDKPLPGAGTAGHILNKLTSSMFLAAVGRQPWHILYYDIIFEQKPVPRHIRATGIASDMDLECRKFRFIGKKAAKPKF